MMTEEVARAFTLRMLGNRQIEQVRELESNLTLPTESLNSFQIAKHFNLKRPELDEVEVSAMNKLWLDFYTKILYPQQQAEELLHPADCSMMSCKHPWDDRCKTKAQEMWQWDDFQLINYKPPQVQSRGLEQILAGVLLLFSVFK